MEREKLLSLTAKDFQWETFRASGKGGQNRNKRDTAVRVTHQPSGAQGYSCEERSQLQNKRRAFKRLAETEKFQRWVRIESMKRLVDLQEVNQKVDEMMAEENLCIEYGGSY